jgi:hypothetical protein
MGRRVWLLLVHRSPLPKTCQAVGQDICHFDSLGVLSPNFIHVFSNFGLSHIRSISRVRHAAELSFESRRLSFSDSDQAIVQYAYHSGLRVHPPYWNVIKQLPDALSSGTNATRSSCLSTAAG